MSSSLLMSMPTTAPNNDHGISPNLSILESHNLATGTSSSFGASANNTSPSLSSESSHQTPYPTIPPTTSSSGSSSTPTTISSSTMSSSDRLSLGSSFHRPAHPSYFSPVDTLRPVVKVRFGDKIKRIALPKSEMASLTMKDLEFLVKKYLNIEEEYIFKYKDTEGDWVLLEDDTDLSNAITIGPILNVQMFKKDCKVTSEITKESFINLKSQLESTMSMIKNLLSFVDNSQATHIEKGFSSEKNTASNMASQFTSNTSPVNPSPANSNKQSLEMNQQGPPMHTPAYKPNPMELSQQPSSSFTPHPLGPSAPSQQKSSSSFSYPAPPSIGQVSQPHPVHSGQSSVPGSPFPTQSMPSVSGLSPSGHFPQQPSQANASSSFQMPKPPMPGSSNQSGVFPSSQQSFSTGSQMMPQSSQGNPTHTSMSGPNVSGFSASQQFQPPGTALGPAPPQSFRPPPAPGSFPGAQQTFSPQSTQSNPLMMPSASGHHQHPMMHGGTPVQPQSHSSFHPNPNFPYNPNMPVQPTHPSQPQPMYR